MDLLNPVNAAVMFVTAVGLSALAIGIYIKIRY